MIKCIIQGTGVNADCLAGTDLASAPGDGVIDVVAASTVNTATMSITAPPDFPIVRNMPLQLRPNGQPIDKDDIHFAVPVLNGAHIGIAIGGTTGTWVVLVTFFDEGEL